GPRVGKAVRLAQLGIPVAHPLLDGGEILELAGMALERLDLEVNGLRDVHDDLGGLPPHQVHLFDLVRFEALRHQLGKGHVVAGQRIHAVDGDARRRAVVPVGGAEILRAGGILADDEVGPMAAETPMRASRVSSSSPSGKPRKSTMSTPSTRAAFFCSSSRIWASRSGVMARSLDPLLPLVRTQYVTILTSR